MDFFFSFLSQDEIKLELLSLTLYTLQIWLKPILLIIQFSLLIGLLRAILKLN